MKKITLTMIFALFIVLSVSAQDKLGFGIKAGINSAMEWSDAGTTGSRFGFHGGFFFEAAISSGLDIQPELVYSMQGASDNSVTDRFDYVNLPVILKIYVNKSRSFSIDVGPQIGYMISAKIASGGTTTNIYDHSDLNKLDVAICLGASYKINRNFYASLRFNYSATKIMDGLDNRNGVGQLGLSYKF